MENPGKTMKTLKETHKERQQIIQKEFNYEKVAHRIIVLRDCLKLLDSEAAIVRNAIRTLEIKPPPPVES